MITHSKSKQDYILKVSNRDFVDQILAEEILLKEFIDWNQVQTLKEFINHSKPINYLSDDFLIQVNSEILDELTNNFQVEFWNVSCFGWYLGKKHKVKMKARKHSNRDKYKSFEEKNPSLEVKSFDKLRASFRPQKVRNILNGAFGLSYKIFKDEYDSFFRKINWQKDCWYINSKELSSFDKQILLQLLLYQNNRNSDLISKIINDSDALRLYYDILNNAMEYFTYQDYKMNRFLEYLAKKINHDDVIRELTELNDRYITKGLPYKPLIKHVEIIQEFLDIAKTENSALINSIDKENNKTSIFLLGMVHMGDTLDSQFEFDTFVPSIVTLTMEHIVDMYNEEEIIVIAFNEDQIEKDRNKKFSYVKEYFEELKHIERIKENLSNIKNDLSNIKHVTTKSEEEYQQNLMDAIEKHDPAKIGKSDFNQLMHQTIHKWFHPDPQRAKYSRKKQQVNRKKSTENQSRFSKIYTGLTKTNKYFFYKK